MTTSPAHCIPAINQLWPQQGGIYVGSRLIDGIVHHVVMPGGTEHDIKKLPQFEIARTDVETAAAGAGPINGFSDWRAPDQEDLQLAFNNSREHFSQEMWASAYISRTASAGHLWTLDFEDGSATNSSLRANYHLRVVRHVVIDAAQPGA